MKLKRQMLLPIIITLGAILTAVAAWVQWKAERDSDILNDTLNKENKALLTKIAELSENTVNNITGGNSRPIFYMEAQKARIPNNPLKEFFIIKFDIKNNGKTYPLRKTTCEITDAPGFAMLRYLKVERYASEFKYDLNPHLQEMKEYNVVHYYEIGTINVNESKPVYATSFQNIDGIKGVDKNSPTGNYQITISTENTVMNYAIYIAAKKNEFIIKNVTLKENGVEVDPKPYFEFHYNSKAITL